MKQDLELYKVKEMLDKLMWTYAINTDLRGCYLCT